MTRKKLKLADLLARCDPSAPTSAKYGLKSSQSAGNSPLPAATPRHRWSGYAARVQLYDSPIDPVCPPDDES
ncbi:hypothetical protein PQR46_08130 [Paraburkholderia sediminicola]|uniref:hypothetical protein n=1 Tax=Paraburkholderia TaxID=1822464 RepID=UPI0038B7A62B